VCVFDPGDKVLLRTPGRDNKLVNAWEGPFVISKSLGPVTYLVDTGRKKVNVVHVYVYKQFVERQDLTQRVTMVLKLIW